MFNLDPCDTAQASILRLFEVAMAYGAQEIVKLPIESFLRMYQIEILRSCAAKPLGFLEFANTIQSDWIFKEAATHIVGSNGNLFAKVKKDLEKMNMLPLFNQKRVTFRDTLKQHELDLFMLRFVVNAKSPEHMVAEYFRRWLAEMLQDDQGPWMGSSYAKVHRQINARAEYMSCIDMDQLRLYLLKWNQKLDSAPKRVLVNLGLQGVYKRAASIIEPILQDATKYQETNTDVNRPLLFLSVDDEELPWNKKS